MPNTAGGQAQLPRGWFEENGYWYYPTPDGQYHLWHNDGTFEEDVDQHHDTTAADDGGHDETGIGRYNITQSWDDSSRVSNQGSVYVSDYHVDVGRQ